MIFRRPSIGEAGSERSRPGSFLRGLLRLFRSQQKLAVDDLESRRNELGSLTYNTHEIRKIESFYNGDLFLGQDASIGNFLEQAQNYRLLHLATHGKSNDRLGEYSFIAFQPLSDSTAQNHLLYVKDLYNVTLKADMVVLSACETGLGEMKRGEGIIGLATGFTYAGAQSIVPSLWSINDRVTADLMEEFYSQFQRGLSKDEALLVAKKQMLGNPATASPYFWAAFIPIGNMEPLATTFPAKWIAYLGGGHRIACSDRFLPGQFKSQSIIDRLNLLSVE